MSSEDLNFQERADLLSEDSSAILATPSSNLINLRIKTLNNEVHEIAVDVSSSVSRLKLLISDATSVESDRQRLIYRGRVLEDANSIMDYRIEDGHTIHMVARPSNYRELQQAAVPSANISSTPAGPRVPAAAAGGINGAQVGIIATPVASGTNLQQILSSLTSPSVLNANRANLTSNQANNNGLDMNMENIRQGLLTVNTLFSTIASIHPSTNGDQSFGNTETKDSGFMRDGYSDMWLSPSERRFYIGQWVDVKDTVSQWLEATILDVDMERRAVFVHYNGWPARWDEWIPFASARIAPFRSRTNHSVFTGYSSPTPNVVPAHAPRTGITDVRTVLPEMARIFRIMQPMVEEMASIATQDIRESPPSRPTSSTAPATSNPTAVDGEDPPPTPTFARGMPWGKFNPSDVPIGAADGNPDLIPETGNDSKSSNEKSAESDGLEQTTKDRLHQLYREMCPLLDRFGRVMADVSTQMWVEVDSHPTGPSVNGPQGSTLEARLLSLLRERPPSPPPTRAYQSPLASLSRNGEEPRILNRPGEHHVDIHIAILSPQQASGFQQQQNLASATRSVSNLTSTLQAQAQQLAARTQELSERTSAVSEITSALGHLLRTREQQNSSLSEVQASVAENTAPLDASNSNALDVPDLVSLTSSSDDEEDNSSNEYISGREDSSEDYRRMNPSQRLEYEEVSRRTIEQELAALREQFRGVSEDLDQLRRNGVEDEEEAFECDLVSLPDLQAPDIVEVSAQGSLMPIRSVDSDSAGFPVSARQVEEESREMFWNIPNSNVNIPSSSESNGQSQMNEEGCVDSGSSLSEDAANRATDSPSQSSEGLLNRIRRSFFRR